MIKDPPSSPSTISVLDDKSDITETVEVESSFLPSKVLSCPDDDDIVETVEEFGSSFLETLEELSSSDLLLSKAKKPKADVNADKTTIEQLDVASTESSPDHEISTDLGIHCIICMRYVPSLLPSLLPSLSPCPSLLP